jgi:ATP-dependent DNA helicase RecQ
MRVQDKGEQLRKIVADHPGQSGIVFCPTPKIVRELTLQLVALGVSATSHDTEDPERFAQFELWRVGKVSVLVGGSGLLAGINKHGVGFIVFARFPLNLTGARQGCGRTMRCTPGRIGHCYFLYRRSGSHREKKSE